MIVLAGFVIFCIQILSSAILLSKILILIGHRNASKDTFSPIKTRLLLIPGSSILFLEYLLLSACNILYWQSIVIVIVLNFAIGNNLTIKQLKEFRFYLKNHKHFLINLLVLAPLAIVQSLLILVPDENTDVAYFHQPLVDSLLQNSGFVWPQIGHPFYGSIPLAFHLFVAGIFAFTGSVLASHIVNFTFFWMFLILILSLTKKIYFKPIFIIIFILTSNYFLRSPTDGMQDLFRSILVVTSLLYLFFAFDTPNTNYLILSGLAAGLALSTKMSELPILLYMILLLLLKNKLSNRRFSLRILFFKLFLPTFCVGSFFYIRNLWHTSNPFYPFLFEHPGLSNEWMENYKTVLSTPYNPLDSTLNNNLYSPASILDFFQAFERYFLGPLPQNLPILILILAFFFSKRFRPILIVNLVMYLIWYYFMLNHVRWALSAYLLSMTLAIILLTEFIYNCKKIQFISRIINKKKRLFYIAFPLFILIPVLLKGQLLGTIATFENRFREFPVYIEAVYEKKLESYFNEKLPNYQVIKFVDSMDYDKVYTNGLGSLNEFSRLYTDKKNKVYTTVTNESYPRDNFIFFKQMDSDEEIDYIRSLNRDFSKHLIFKSDNGKSLWCIKIISNNNSCD
jgi:hypothetical protein